MGVLFSFLMVWGTFFSSLAGLLAFLISYREMVHHYMESKAPLKQALQTGFFTFLLFMAVTLALAYGLPSLFS
jgi:uncharacterized membrane protein